MLMNEARNVQSRDWIWHQRKQKGWEEKSLFRPKEKIKSIISSLKSLGRIWAWKLFYRQFFDPPFNKLDENFNGAMRSNRIFHETLRVKDKFASLSLSMPADEPNSRLPPKKSGGKKKRLQMELKRHMIPDK